MSDIRAFLARAVPWPTAAAPGFVDIHWTNRDQNTGAFRGLSGHAFTDHEAAARFAYGMSRNSVDMYVCMSLQADAEAPTLSRSGKPRRRAKRSWDGALLLRSHWVDVDVKPGFFATTAEALLAFHAWRVKVGLPEPTFIIMTGSGGFHVHWVYDDPITRGQWLPIAYALQQALKVEQFPCDYGVVVNPACILRIPGGKNYKITPPADVTIAQSLQFTYPFAFVAQQLDRYKVAYAVPVSTAATATRLAFKPNPKLVGLNPGPPLNAGVKEWAPTFDEIAAACPFMADTRQNHGKGYGEPLWRESLRIASFCEDGDKIARMISDGHDEYDEPATDAKFHQIALHHGGGKVGWPQCRTINTAGATQCPRCPHFVADKSPLNYVVHVTQPAAQPPPTQRPVPVLTTALVSSRPPLRVADVNQLNFGYGPLPDGYKYAADGTVYVEVPDPDDPKNKPPVWVQAFPNPLYDLDVHEPTAEGMGYHGMSFLCQADAVNLRKVTLRMSEVNSQPKFNDACSDRAGIASDDMPNLRRLCLSFRDQMYARKRTSSKSETLGWSIEDGHTEPNGFCYAGLRHTAAGTFPYTPTDTTLSRKYQPTGALDVWKQAAALIVGQNRPDLNCAIAASFAAPLVSCTGMSGAVLSVWSNASGIGKTHALRIAQAVWGNPKTGMGALSDTAAFVVGILAELHNLPFFYDELRQEADTKKMVELIFGMGQGKSKGRMSAGAEVKEVVGFSTLLTIASNTSLMSYINDHVQTTSAGINRIFELEIAPAPRAPGLIDSTVAETVNGSLEHNYGHAGSLYAQYLGGNAVSVRGAVAKATAAFNDALKASHDERFWITTIATLVVGAKFANHLGLTAIDIPGLTTYLVGRFEQNRNYRKGAPVDMEKQDNVLRYVQDYVNARRDATLVTDTVWRLPHRPPTSYKAQQVNGNVALDNKAIYVRIARDDQIMRVSQSNFGLWLKKDRGVQKDIIIDAAVKTLGARRLKSTLSMGVAKLVTAREDLLEFDLSNLPDLLG